MKKKLLYSLFYAFLLLVNLLPATTFAANKTEYFIVDGLRFFTEEDGQSVTLEGCEDPEIEKLVVPDTIVRESDGKKFTVVRIGTDFKTLKENMWSSSFYYHNFCKMKNLRTIDLSKAVHLEEIGFFKKVWISGKSYCRVSYAFCDNPNLTEIIFPQNGTLKEISCSFNNIPITAIDLPEGLTTINGHAFNDCHGLKDVRLPSTISIIKSEVLGTTKYPFDNTDLNNLVILSDNISFSSVISAKKTFRPFNPEYYGATNASDQGIDSDRYYLLLDKNTAVQPIVKAFSWEFKSYEVPFAEHGPNPYTIDGSICSDNDGKCIYHTNSYGDKTMSFTTTERPNPLSVRVRALNFWHSPTGSYYGLETNGSKRRRARLVLYCKTDDSFDKNVLTIVVRETKQTLYAENENPDNYKDARYVFTVENLHPNTNYTVGLYFGNKHLGDYTFKTKGLVPSFKKTALGITTFEGVGTYNLEGDESDEIEEQFISFNGKKYPGKEITLTGLAPTTEYELSYSVKMKDTGLETKNFKFKTAGPLSLKTLNPKVVSRSAAIVGAESNLSEKETHAGLEWRKIDAPEEIPSKRVYITPIDGFMEGRIENLNTSVYYKVRAFYENYDGSKQWYGEWIGFDPSDFSYFVPTVHTFESVVPEENSADVKGYVLAGTDDIVSQGFEYWPSSSKDSSAPRLRMLANEEYSTVLANGQIMTATLPNLIPNKEYSFRSFAKTVKEITYGEIRTFRTKESYSTVTEIETEQPTSTIEGYYDLHGVCHEAPVRGFNIIRYSDGSVRKIIVK